MSRRKPAGRSFRKGGPASPTSPNTSPGPDAKSGGHLPQLWPVVPTAGHFGGDSWLKFHEAHVKTVQANQSPLDTLKPESEPKMRILDLTADFTNADGTMKKELFTPDNIHLSPAGCVPCGEAEAVAGDETGPDKGMGMRLRAVFLHIRASLPCPLIFLPTRALPFPPSRTSPDFPPRAHRDGEAMA